MMKAVYLLVNIVCCWMNDAVSSSSNAEAEAEKCEKILMPDVKECSKGNHSIFPAHPYCVNHTVCNKTFNVSIVDFEPFSSSAFQDIATYLVGSCCGPCTKTLDIRTFNDVTEVNSSSISDSDIVFPVLGHMNTKRLYTYYFVPMLEVTGGYYLTEKQSSEELLRRFIGSLYNVWPLLVVILVLAVLAGFIMWLMETHFNEEQFSRSFRIGLLDGFWWSFISMTTVGYGDKTPKFVCSRIFSVLWILIGITICSMFTASLTAELTLLNTPPLPTLDGSKVGVLKNRFMDAVIVAGNGAVVHESEHSSVAQGVEELVKLTREKKIDGFFVDKFTFMYAEKYFTQNASVQQQQHVKTDVTEFFKYRDDCNLSITKIKYDGEKMSYGFLMKKKEDFDYFHEFIINNREAFDLCKILALNKAKKKGEKGEKREIYLFNPSGGYFYPILVSSGATLFVILLLGFTYEVFRSGCKLTKKTRTKKVTEAKVESSETDSLFKG